MSGSSSCLARSSEKRACPASTPWRALDKNALIRVSCADSSGSRSGDGIAHVPQITGGAQLGECDDACGCHRDGEQHPEEAGDGPAERDGERDDGRMEAHRPALDPWL